MNKNNQSYNNELNNNLKAKQTNDSKPLENLPGILFGSWFISSIIAILIFSDINKYYAIIVFGQLFFGFGLFFLIALKKEGLIGIPFILVGLGCIIIPIITILN